MARRRRLDEANGILAKTPREFLAAVVRFGGYFNNGFTHPQARAHGKIRSRNIELDNEIVAGSCEGPPICQHLRHISSDDSKLRIGIARRAPIPLVTGYSFFWRKSNVV